MLVSYVDLSDPAGRRRTVEATVTTKHAASSYGRPVVLVDGEVVDALSWVALDYRVERATSAERTALRRAFGR